MVIKTRKFCIFALFGQFDFPTLFGDRPQLQADFLIFTELDLSRSPRQNRALRELVIPRGRKTQDDHASGCSIDCSSYPRVSIPLSLPDGRSPIPPPSPSPSPSPSTLNPLRLRPPSRLIPHPSRTLSLSASALCHPPSLASSILRLSLPPPPPALPRPRLTLSFFLTSSPSLCTSLASLRLPPHLYRLHPPRSPLPALTLAL